MPRLSRAPVVRSRVAASVPALALVAVLLASPELQAQPPYQAIVSDGNALGTTLTNYGFIGNNFVSRSPSLEYPLGTGYEHLVRGGLWVGAHAVDGSGAFTGVVTAALDWSQGVATPSLTEFTPASLIRRRSTYPASAWYSPDAISELDLISTYDDLTPKRATGNTENHRPMGLLVRQESYAWSSYDWGDILFFHVVIKNLGAPLSDVWVGVYTEFASGPKNQYSTWPPAPGGSPLGSWYRKKWLQYDASLRLLREHRCVGSPPPGACQMSVTPYWMGLKLLDPPQPERQVTVVAWEYAPGALGRDQDTERYAYMSAGTIQNLAAFVPGSSDPTELIALGPFLTINPGDSLSFDFALVGGAEVNDIQANAFLAQQIHDMHYQPPVATTASLASAEARPDRVALTWFSSAPPRLAPRVERRDPQGDWSPVGEAAVHRDLITFEDRSVEAGRRYGYRLDLGAGGGDRFTAETWIDVPLGAVFALEGLRPNPHLGGDLVASFSLSAAGAARLALYDVAGRRVRTRVLDRAEAGHHLLVLGAGAGLPPGVYVLELRQGDRRAIARVTLVR